MTRYKELFLVMAWAETRLSKRERVLHYNALVEDWCTGP